MIPIFCLSHYGTIKLIRCTLEYHLIVAARGKKALCNCNCSISHITTYSISWMAYHEDWSFIHSNCNYIHRQRRLCQWSIVQFHYFHAFVFYFSEDQRRNEYFMHVIKSIWLTGSNVILFCTYCCLNFLNILYFTIIMYGRV